MKIAAADVQMAASHASLQHHEVSESLRAWVGDRRPDFEGNGDLATTSPTSPATSVSLSPEALAAQAQDGVEAADAKTEDTLDPKLSLLKTLIEYFTGRKIELFSQTSPGADAGTAAAGQAAGGTPADGAPAKAGYGVEYDYHESYTEMEQTTFSAQGKVRTSDGQEISFDLNLAMSRLYHEESSVSIRAGDAVKKDPLVLNFAGTAAQLSDQRFAFDIDSDGKDDMINFTAGGSGFLVFDKDGNGQATNGSELFGTRSGDGFAELAAYDADRNGWIDENDPVFEQLRIWIKDGAGRDQLLSLADKGVGAIGLQHLSTPFDVKTAENRLQASVLASGVFLQQNGAVGSIQQLDLTV